MYRKDKPINWIAFRITLVAVIFAAFTVVLVVRAIQVADP